MVTLHSILEMQDILDIVIVHLNSEDVHALRCTSKTTNERLLAHSASNNALAQKLTDKLRVRVAVNQGLAFFQWARDAGCPWDVRICSAVAERGHLKVLQWARANGCPWNEATCEAAAEGGHLETLQWARAQDPPCPWNVRICYAAGKAGGHLETLQWARAQDPPCPWNETVCYVAAQRGDVETLQWAQANGCPSNEEPQVHASVLRGPWRLCGGLTSPGIHNSITHSNYPILQNGYNEERGRTPEVVQAPAHQSQLEEGASREGKLHRSTHKLCERGRRVYAAG
eukprot:CAMPEP_0118957930 /NCGR_PEP_ID=MMETSP1169-20130426/62360_1 /TAXON_ID=36882 /ORGANISM="Pyramimonas obovata, Strain CCMP722" /LENGTH=284 /DNA_ID=CAMNT_0006906033 /DNA_START=581 /DNA_END=1433 /DNA_ORIENTATION=-